MNSRIIVTAVLAFLASFAAFLMARSHVGNFNAALLGSVAFFVAFLLAGRLVGTRRPRK